MIGPPAPLFYVYNNLQSHEVTVEVFDSHNESVFKKTYEPAPEERIVQSKSLWLLLRWSITWSKGKYTYWAEGEYESKVILDKEITGNCRILLHPWNSAVINIDEMKDSNSPISMGIVTV